MPVNLEPIVGLTPDRDPATYPPVQARRPWRSVAMLGALALVLACVGSTGAGRAHARERVSVAGALAIGHRASPTGPVHLTVEVNGDILVHSPVWERARADGHGHYDFAPMLRQIRPYVRSADLAICHIETPMTPRPPEGYPVFNTPTQLARAIRQTGWQVCDTASNHSVDQGQYGIDQTGRALDRAGVRHTGSFPSRAAQQRTLMMTVKGVKVAFLAYTEMTNGIPLPHPWSVNIARVNAVERAARLARRRGAQVVIVNFHWGTEFQAAPDAFQLATARALTRDSDITAIVGQHVHVVQPIRRVNGKLVVFGEGQLLSNQSAACCSVQTEDGMLVFLHITVDRRTSRVVSIGYVPTWDRHPDYTVLPIGQALARHQAPAGVLRASYDRTTAVVGRIPHVLGPIPGRLPAP
jgi:poly-gamma-glutamate capsule biosynthesis protein CapA/YwtB (metallophosphatase superfamily)